MHKACVREDDLAVVNLVHGGLKWDHDIHSLLSYFYFIVTLIDKYKLIYIYIYICYYMDKSIFTVCSH